MVITANLLGTGKVVFLGRTGGWVESIDDARVYPDATAAEAGMAEAQRDQERAIVVEAFVATTGERTHGRPAMSLRDTIRAYGPTVRFAAPTPAR